MSGISFRRKPGAKKVSIVRYRYIRGSGKRSLTITLGSFPIDGDPEDVRLLFTPSRTQRAQASVDQEPLSEDHYTLMKAWLIKHGDAEAVSRRAARDRRVQQALIEKFQIGMVQSRDEFEDAVVVLRRAGAIFLEQAEDNSAEMGQRWQHLRPKYMKVYKAFDDFKKSAAAAGATKKIRGEDTQSITEKN